MKLLSEQIRQNYDWEETVSQSLKLEWLSAAVKLETEFKMLQDYTNALLVERKELRAKLVEGEIPPIGGGL